ncbi:ATPase [Spirochaetia bacterium]|nr:ATPase [Spirochaetia bacterium]
MYRKLIEDLWTWKERTDHRPLIIRGARQTGKTWLMKEFGRAAYAETVYISFDNNPQMEALFEADLNIDRIITGLELYWGQKIAAERTLIIFDEIQEVPKALTALKYFYENAPQYDIVCAGSLLGIALHPGGSFPVGKVEFLDLYPLSFGEFMRALGEERFIGALEQGDYQTVTLFKQNYIDLLKYYYYVGGMPEVVQAFVTSRDFNQVREIQERLLFSYEQDFSKHAPPLLVPKIRMLWNSIPGQLARENKKFIYGLIKAGSRAAEYELALLWLSDCGLVHQVHRVTAPRLPLKAYEDLRAFKLFMLDVGLLSCMTALRQETLLNGDELFREFKGALTEQYVLQELKTQKGIQTYYWSNDKGLAEVDFVVGLSGVSAPVPLEVKAEINLQAKSLKSYLEKFQPPLSVRVSMADYTEHVDANKMRLVSVPLYGIGVMPQF